MKQERLTTKTDDKLYPYKYLDVDDCMQGTPINKLGQHEDIEERYGIDLITLVNALENGAWFRNPYYKNEINFIKDLEFSFDLKKKCFDIRMDHFVKFYDYRTGGALFYFKDFGDTWALTREALQ